MSPVSLAMNYARSSSQRNTLRGRPKLPQVTLGHNSEPFERNFARWSERALSQSEFPVNSSGTFRPQYIQRRPRVWNPAAPGGAR